MELSVLVDNNTFIDRYFLAEPGLSFFIQEGEKSILFDTGYSDIFIRNAEKMMINLRNLDYIVFSHGHVDHTWGLTHLLRMYMEARTEGIACMQPTIVGHPSVFESKILEPIGEIGSILSEKKLNKHFNVHLTKQPVWLTDKLVFLGEIEQFFTFEGQSPIGKIVIDDNEYDDFVRDDTAIAYKSSEGLVIMVGCAHAGICNIIEHAKKICNEERIVDVIGGFHLLNPSQEQLTKTVAYMEKLNLSTLHACHCTDFYSKAALSTVTNIKEVGVGLKRNYT